MIAIVINVGRRSHRFLAQLFPIIALVGTLLLGPTPGAATDIVVLATPNTAYLAADSLAIEAATKRSFLMCKLQHHDHFFWGFKGFRNTKTGFDPDKILVNIIRTHQELPDVIKAYSSTIQPILKRNAPVLKHDDPAYYDAMIKNQAPLLALYIVKLDTKGVEAQVVGHHFINNQLVVRSEVCDFKGRDSCVLTSKHPSIDAYFAMHQDQIWSNKPGEIWAGNDPQAVVDRLMELGRSIEPDLIGPPYSIVQISPIGASWIRKGVCEDSLLTAPYAKKHQLK